MREPDMACLAHLTYMDIGNVIMMSGTSLTMCFKVFRHPVYQMPARFREGMSFFSIHDIRESIHIRFPWEALVFSLFINKMAEAELKLSQRLDQSPWRPFRSCCFVKSENVAGQLG
ncbi:hypothetical protein [Shewanella sp. SG41-3]|uniref:hypothetical protein n=1 Tax=Shewanella sp. SG41-3 TaxID=2760977 RepID=UPI001C718882|nr:hypothetical protein [Shewanella sp. SG41-3]